MWWLASPVISFEKKKSNYNRWILKHPNTSWEGLWTPKTWPKYQTSGGIWMSVGWVVSSRVSPILFARAILTWKRKKWTTRILQTNTTSRTRPGNLMADASHLRQIYTKALFMRALPKRMKKTCKITGYHTEHSIYSRDDYMYIYATPPPKPTFWITPIRINWQRTYRHKCIY